MLKTETVNLKMFHLLDVKINYNFNYDSSVCSCKSKSPNLADCSSFVPLSTNATRASAQQISAAQQSARAQQTRRNARGAARHPTIYI